MTDVDVLVPLRLNRTKEPLSRREAWRYVRAFWSEQLHEYRVITGDDGGQPFSRGSTLNQLAARSTAPVLVIADADVVAEPYQVHAAVEQCQQAATGMVLAFDDYVPLSPEATTLVYAGDLEHLAGQPVAPWTCISALFAITRKHFHAAGGFDPRFRGWGREDDAFKHAVETLVGHTWRISGRCYHLNHPRELVKPRDNEAMLRQYVKAAGHRHQMRELVAGR